jgi:hypothetical protein
MYTSLSVTANSTPNLTDQLYFCFEYYLITTGLLRKKLNGFMLIIKIILNKLCVIKYA